jgi:uncharacterized protein
MSLKHQLEQDLLDSMRAKNEIGRNTLRMVISSVKMYEIEKSSEIDDASVLGIIQKEIKTRRDSLVEFEKGKRNDLIETTNKEIVILEKYLPKQLSDIEIEQLVKKIVIETGASTPADIGKVMKGVLPLLAGKAPSDRVSIIVRKVLSNK